MNNPIHIVCLDAPSPPDYGGAIDMYYKIIALAQSGRKIILHFFDYNNSRGVKGLEEWCSEIHAYKRKGISSVSLQVPYIINSRINRQLIEKLNKYEYPILLEGLHCSGIIPFINKKERIVVRMHNEEAEYYKRLAAQEQGMVRRLYFSLESRLIHKYYKRLAQYPVKYACLSSLDMEKFQGAGLRQFHFIPCFIPWQEIRIREGKGDYCLYHGNMKVAENVKAAEWLAAVFRKLDMVLVIAGNGISGQLKSLAKNAGNLRLIDRPSMEELDALIRDAHINVLPSMNATGVKLKVLHALTEGRFCISNQQGVAGSGVEHLVTIANNKDDFRKKLIELYEIAFTEEHKKNRGEVLAVYNNIKNAAKLNALY